MPKKLIIFDLDGTLYELRGGSYQKSPLQKIVLSNAQKYIAKKLDKKISEAKRILAAIQKKYGEDISIGLEKEFGFDRYDYFNTVWDIAARGVVKKEQSPRKPLLALKKKYKLILLSDAPQVWISNVLSELQVKDLFSGAIFSGEGDSRKGFGNAFANITRKLKVKPVDCFVVGDQEKTDIIPAKKIGMRTVFIHKVKRSTVADANIKAILQLPAAIEKLVQK